ncbi:polysaccharide deacetylase family protein [Roseivirga sp.]|uniref:polysaccharide deacetylase family protein n=1 Tax=Roseivirga sp. TaxID=1964215 RepID=UPI003B8DCFB5
MRVFLVIVSLFLVQLNSFSFQQNNFSTFVYHRFGDDRYPSTNISLDNFEAQLSFLSEEGYEVISLNDAFKQLKSSPKDLSKTVVITIDDAYKSFYQNGWPLLKKYGFKATLFVNTKTVGASDYMTWKELKEVQSEGVEIANHSHAHPYFMNDFSVRKFYSDLTISQAFFQNMIGSLPDGYAYPYGEWHPEMGNLLDSLGYSYAAAQNSGVVYQNSPSFQLPRFPMSDAYAGLDEFKQKADMNALEIQKLEVIDNNFKGSKEKPRVLLKFKEADYDLKNLQCFIQGTKAKKSIEVLKDGDVVLSIWPEEALNQRRTLFTVTVTDKKGKWHWFSYSYLLLN